MGVRFKPQSKYTVLYIDISKISLILCDFFDRILDHVEEGKHAKKVDMEEGENIKQQVDMYMAAKKTIEEQRRKVG